MESRRRLDPLVVLIATGGVLLLLALATRYGYHRDELYFLRAGQDLAWGYVDQPPFTALVARVVDELFRGWLFALRALPAIGLAALIVGAGKLAAEFGGGRNAQCLAALCTGLSGQFLGAHHLLSTSPFDNVAWIAVILLVVKIVREERPRIWPVVGFVVGLALFNKWMILFAVAGLIVGLLASDHRRLLITPWLLVGGAIALVMWLPNLLWQASHGWPALEMAAALAEEFRSEEGPFVYVAGQILYPGPLSAPIWIAGVVSLARDQTFRRWRFLVVAWVFLLVLFLVTGGKPYYLGPTYIPLFAAGAVALERRFAQRHRAQAGLFALVLVGGLGSIVIALPILPPRTLADVPLQEINYDLGEQIGWPEFVNQVGAFTRANVPANQRRRDRIAILTSNYGEAGAIDHFGPEKGMELAYSGHNSYWYWGPPPASTDVVIAVGFRDPGFLDRFFTQCRPIGRIRSPYGLDNGEAGAPVAHCRVSRPWPEIWPELFHYR